jgi:flagellar basal-body rod modification protein FlgD
MILDGVSSSASSTGSGRSSADKYKLENDLNRFLTLLVTQLRNQDPLEPLDANQFTSQLVQFASVEQQIYQNSHLEELLALQRNDQLTSSVGYLGNVVEASGTSLPLQNGTATMSYRLGESAMEATVTIRDSNGRNIYSVLVAKEPGVHEFTWDGRDRNGNPVPDGSYAFQVDALDRAGRKLSVAHAFTGQVTGIASGPDGTVLRLGDIELPIGRVTEVRSRTEPVAREE